MLKILVILVVILLVGGIAAAYTMGFIGNPSPTEAVKEKSVYDFTMQNIDGKDVKLDAYKGKVLLIVNTASKCGFTPQYEGLESIYEKYKDQNFVILGFPANNFLGQEPGTNEEIKEFCAAKYKVSFPMFAKISVKGEDQHPLYNFLTNPKTDPQFAGDISWNFNKFLIDRNGNIVARFDSKAAPESPEVTQTIEKYLAAK
jgi:glutathione peroxidase